MPDLKKTDTELKNEIVLLQQRIEDLESKLGDKKQISAQLEEEHSFRKSVIERAAEGICVCHYTPKFPFVQFTLWNPKMKEITGYSMDQINRLGWYQMMYPDPEIQELARRRMIRMRKGEDLLNEKWKISRADGQERTFGISTSILETHDNKVHVLAMMQDITEKVRYQEQMEDRIVALEGLLSICASCKRIRSDTGDWEGLEEYISKRSEAVFSHSICPECAEELYPDLL